jgi:phosphonopyruvate decarboxylase
MIGRYDAIAKILEHVESRDVVLSTTGMISREVFMAKDRPGNLYMIGSMGLLSALALGLALVVPDRRVFALEGDGSALMSLGTLPLIAALAPANLVHVILDNEAYESTGGQPSISSTIDLAEVGRACRYRHVERVDGPDGLDRVLPACGIDGGPHLILVKVDIAPVKGIPRVSRSPEEMRDALARQLRVE